MRSNFSMVAVLRRKSRPLDVIFLKLIVCDGEETDDGSLVCIFPSADGGDAESTVCAASRILPLFFDFGVDNVEGKEGAMAK